MRIYFLRLNHMEVIVSIRCLMKGKYAPTIATAILDFNEEHMEKIPLKGVSIGNQWTDPNTQILTHAAACRSGRAA